MKELAPLQAKLALLIKRYSELKDENTALKATVSRREEELAALKVEEERLRQEFAQENLKEHLQELPEQKKEQIKNQIENILKMIEKNINLLN